MKKYQLSAEVTVSAEDEEEKWIIEDADGSAQNVHEA